MNPVSISPMMRVVKIEFVDMEFYSWCLCHVVFREEQLKKSLVCEHYNS
jgi:hypothetical protein